MKIFQKPIEILKILEDNGFEAYLVGGCVRDYLLNRPLGDWDMTTSATPQDVMALFPHTIPTGIQHGTVTVLHQGEPIEITTFRSDGDYQDNRHPDQVSFVKSLSQDLARRDFTINAMALDRYGNLTDLHNGRSDLKSKVIRTVGDPQTRFQEDALRILRAYRFSAQLGFALDPATQQATKICASLCHHLSTERVLAELQKTIASPAPHILNSMLEIGLLDPYFPKTTLTFTASSPMARWAQIKQQIPELDLRKLRLDNKTIKLATAVSTAPPTHTILDLKLFLWKNGLEAGNILAEVTNTEYPLSEILQNNHCYSLPQLALSGRDLPHLSGKSIGQTLNQLLLHVIHHPEDNTKETLLHLADTIVPQKN